MSVVAVSGILFAVACGSGGAPAPPLGGSFTNASLSGQYILSQTGIGVNQQGTGVNPFSETVIFTADGNGNLAVTCDDFDQVGGPYGGPGSISGTYSIRSDGTGSLNIGGSGGFNFTVTLIDDSHFYSIETDTFATGSGYGEKQDTTAFTAAPAGTFVFKSHYVSTSSRVGGITISSGAISGTEDFLNLGTLANNLSVSTSVPMSAPDAVNGRGTFALTDGTSFNYYVVGANKFRFMSNSASGSLEIGQAQTQSGGPFSLATLTNGSSYVFGSAGDTTISGQAGIHSAGVYSTDGAGNITSGGAVDYVQDTTVNSNLAVNGGAYTLASSGRGTVNLTLAGGTISPQIFWMVDPNDAYFLANNTAAVEDGTFTLQTGGTSITGQAALVMDGFDTTFKDRVGVFEPTSSGFNWNQTANAFDPNAGVGIISGLGTSGSFAFGTNGRVAVTVNNVTGALVFYISSANSGYMVQEDANIGGAFAQQASQ
jgi:hypothetical protein